jgi:DNA-binding transcriptional MerR regulator
MVEPERTECPPERFRVEELSVRTGVPVRTIREYQGWQVLHPPTRVGRVGFYDESHVRLLETIGELQGRGYSIAAIRDLLAAWEEGAGLRDVLGIEDSIGLTADEAAIALPRDQMERLLPSIMTSTRLTARAGKAGLFEADGDGFVARSPALLQLVADAIRAGLSPSAALDLAATVVSAAAAVGQAAAQVVAEQVTSESDLDAVGPLVRRGRVLLARAVATHTIDQVGRYLLAEAESQPELAELIANVRVGRVTVRPTTINVNTNDKGAKP